VKWNLNGDGITDCCVGRGCTRVGSDGGEERDMHRGEVGPGFTKKVNG